MIAEKAADMILGRELLKPIHIDPNTDSDSWYQKKEDWILYQSSLISRNEITNIIWRNPNDHFFFEIDSK